MGSIFSGPGVRPGERRPPRGKLERHWILDVFSFRTRPHAHPGRRFRRLLFNMITEIAQASGQRHGGDESLSAMGELVPLGSGRMSVFGGPADEGVGPHEGLALIGPTDLALWWFSCLFRAEPPAGTTGLARRLNPRAYYLAMRWDYERWPKLFLRNTVVKLTNPANGRYVFARPVDFGPGDGTMIDGAPTPDTGRLADLSPGAATALGLQTDEVVGCEMVG